MKIILNLVLLSALVALGYWAYLELLAGETRLGSGSHPLGVMAASAFFSVYVSINIVLTILEPHIKKNPRLHARLYSGFWTFLLGSEKQTDET